MRRKLNKYRAVDLVGIPDGKEPEIFDNIEAAREAVPKTSWWTVVEELVEETYTLFGSKHTEEKWRIVEHYENGEISHDV